jgi:uncharacterized protein YndB with AHSA1/START domain
MTRHPLDVRLQGDRELVHTRVFDAPRADVFAALTRPELLARWYGPRGWTLVACEIDLRVGGAWRFVTRKPDGREIVQHGVYLEVVAPARLANTEHWLDWDVGEVVVTVELAEQAGRTTLTQTTRFPSERIRAELLAHGADAGTREHYDELDDFLSA